MKRVVCTGLCTTLFLFLSKDIPMPGKYFEDLLPGQKISHTLGRTLTETDNVLFNSITMNTQPLHINADFAKDSLFGRPIVNGILTMGLVVGITVPDLTEGTLIGNLGYERVSHPRPVFCGDTIYVETEILESRPSRSRPDRGIVRFKHLGRNQHGEVVIELERTALILKRSATEKTQGA
jgi:acyl dehydratase